MIVVTDIYHAYLRKYLRINQLLHCNFNAHFRAVAKDQWDELKTRAEEHREEDLLDCYGGEIEVGGIPEIREKRRKALKSVRDKMRINDTLSHLAKVVGKPKKSLLKLRVINPRTKEIKNTCGRKEIESALAQHNRCHFSKAKNTPVYRDKITKAMHEDEVRDKILDGTLKREDVDNSDLIEFLKLLM